MAKQVLNLGTQPDDGSGTDGRSGGQIINENFTELYDHKDDTANPHGTDVGNLGSGTLAELNTVITDATLVDAAHTHTASNITDFDTEVSNNTDVAANTAHTAGTKLNQHGNISDASLTIGDGSAGVDYTLTFDGETNDGVLTWMEDEDEFRTSDDFLFSGHVAMGSAGAVDDYATLLIDDAVTSTAGAVHEAMKFTYELSGEGGFVASSPVGLLLDVSTATTAAIVKGQGTVKGIKAFTRNNSTETVNSQVGIETQQFFTNTGGTTTNLTNFLSAKPTYKVSTTVTNAIGIDVQDMVGGALPTVTNAYGIKIDNQTLATNRYGIVLNGDGVGSDIVFGAGKDASIYYDNTDLIIDPDLVGTGKVLIGATGDDDMKLNAIEIDGDLNHDGTNVGFYGATPVAQPAAYTQTYSTATRTHAARTVATLTDSTGGSKDNTVAAITAVNGSGATTAQEADINNNFAEVTEEINALAADQQNTAQLLNQLIDDLQANGLIQ